jgi:mono/diheme cytochrome c family protein
MTGGNHSRASDRAALPHAMRLIAAAALAGTVLSLSGIQSFAADISAAAKTYASYCASCHGKWGRGDGPSAVALKSRPQDLAAPAVQKLPDETIFEAIKKGGGAVGLNPAMHGWGQGLDDSQIRGLVAFIRALPRN